MKKMTTTLITSLSLFISANLMADTLKLKDGQVLTGALISKNAAELVFDIAGQKLTFDSAKVESISFDNTSLTAQEQPKEQQIVQKSVNAVPSGTSMMVKMSSTVDSNKHSTGHKFTARLEADIVVGDNVRVPRGTTLYGVVTDGKKSGRATGSASLEIAFTDMMINNQLIPIQTTGLNAVTESTAKGTVGRTARLAAVGGLANGSKGAKNAAKIGLGVSLLSGGNSINIPSGTLLEFQLTSPVHV